MYVLLYNIRPCVLLFRIDFNILEVNVTGVPYVKAFSGQRAPHRSLGIFGGLLVTQRLVDVGQLCAGYASTMMNADVADVNVFYRMVGQSADRPAVVAAVPRAYIIYIYA